MLTQTLVFMVSFEVIHSQELTTSFSFDYISEGVMFEIEAYNNLEIIQLQYSMEPCDFSDEIQNFYWKNGSYKNSSNPCFSFL